MKLQAMFKGMLLSQGYVATLRALREIAPEALPDAAHATDAARDVAAAPTRPESHGRRPVASGDDADAIDLAGAMPWQLAFARRAPRTTRACCR